MLEWLLHMIRELQYWIACVVATLLPPEIYPLEWR